MSVARRISFLAATVVLPEPRLESPQDRLNPELVARHPLVRLELLGQKRRPTPTEHVLSLSEIALLETNRPENFMHGTVAVLGVATAASLAVTVVCATNPKTCFGSCPLCTVGLRLRLCLAEAIQVGLLKLRQRHDLSELDPECCDGLRELRAALAVRRTHREAR